MDGRVLIDSSDTVEYNSQDKAKLQDWELFDKMLPFFLACGMPYDLYWNGDPYLPRAYYQAQKMQNERKNQEMWLQGLYIHNAFSVVLSNAFSKKGSKPQRYIDKPIPLYPKSKEEREAEAIKEREKAIRSFQAMMDAQKQKSGIGNKT